MIEAIIAILCLGFVAAIASHFYTRSVMLAVMLRESKRDLRRLNRQSRADKTHIDLLTDKLLVKSGFGQLRPQSAATPTITEPTRGRIVSPSEAISRQKEKEEQKLPGSMAAKQVPSNIGNAFLKEASKFNRK